MTKILVTGGAGFIGSHLVKKLLKNYEVIAFDNLSTGKISNIPREVNFIRGDIRNKKDLEKIEKTNYVFHLAAQVSVPFSVSNPNIDAEINILGTINLLDWCKKNKVEKIIYLSSAAVYGEPRYLPINEKHKTEPISPYGISKLAAEKYLSLLENSIILRIANVYGLNCEKGEPGVIPIFISQIKENKPLTIFGDGTQTRDFVNVKDVVRVCISALKYDGKERVFNIGSGKETTINQIVEIFKKFRKNLKVSYLPKREGEIYRSFFDISKPKKELKFKPFVDLEKGIKELLTKENIL